MHTNAGKTYKPLASVSAACIVAGRFQETQGGAKGMSEVVVPVTTETKDCIKPN